MIAGMKPAVSPADRTVARDGEAAVLDVLGELIDAHADTVQLIMSEGRSDFELLAHCDYLRALQRLGNETLAHHHERTPPPPLALAAGFPSRVNTAVAHAKTAALVGLHGLLLPFMAKR